MLVALSASPVDRSIVERYRPKLVSGSAGRAHVRSTFHHRQRNVQHRLGRSVRRESLSEGPHQAALEDGSLPVHEAWQLLLQFNEADMRAQRGSGAVRSTTREERDALRSAVRVAVEHAWPEAGWDPAARPVPLMLGVLSGDVRLAVRALRDYAQALGFDFLMPQSKVPGQPQLSAIAGGVYIKHNVRSGSATVSEYSGSHRGVLLQLGQQQIGHLPLGLFDEAKSAPPPPMT